MANRNSERQRPDDVTRMPDASGATGGDALEPRAAGALGNTKGRSGGVVDAPGKKHRKPMPSDPGAKQAASQAAKMRAVKTMIKTNRRRGRG
jgi:hypothetical protein